MAVDDLVKVSSDFYNEEEVVAAGQMQTPLGIGCVNVKTNYV